MCRPPRNTKAESTSALSFDSSTGPLIHALGIGNEANLINREDVFVLHEHAVVILHADQAKSITAYGEILLRDVEAVDDWDRVNYDQVTREIAGILD